jgi:hypothetical protein
MFVGYFFYYLTIADRAFKVVGVKKFLRQGRIRGSQEAFVNLEDFGILVRFTHW